MVLGESGYALVGIQMQGLGVHQMTYRNWHVVIEGESRKELRSEGTQWKKQSLYVSRNWGSKI
jgi:hypothetical protein